ncbi:GATA-binding factor 1-B [Trametes pubescens]|uniref:GATA-binding factor 1-B n=1 Tax=Trametes pubescens TaxID=154538 RepID=A0A1M2VUN3_TRAPU|nr:GATA-binding factor 1-B [Trametes pubescens]
MPSILNLKFKGNKSFVPFSNLSDADTLTKTWKVCTKVASFLEQGQRLENLSWRLWHLQNVMVDTDNAKSKRDFKKLSKCMSDKLDKEKGRSIEELQAPGFRRNHSTDLLQQRALEKEREREANQNSHTIHRMQFTFSVDQPSGISSIPAKKPDTKPSAEFKDHKRGRPATRSSANDDMGSKGDNVEKDQPLTQRGRKAPTTNGDNGKEDMYRVAALRFPSLFSDGFGPSALLYPTPTVSNAMTYGEGVGLSSSAASDGFSIPRPTIELPLDELLNADSPGGWSSGGYHHHDSRTADRLDAQEDVEMKVTTTDVSYQSHAARAEPANEDEGMLKSNGALRNVPHLSHIEDVVPRTITPSRIGPSSGPGANTNTTTTTTSKRPSLSVRTQVSTRSNGPSATPVNSSQQNSNSNSAPGGVKAECSNCGATHTPLWRRGLNDELNCNACGLYCKLHKRPRPKSMRNNHGEGRAQAAPRQESQEVVAQCYNCHTTATPLWRKDDEGKTVCNACGLYYKLHGSARPISMKSDVIRKRARHDARRAGNSVSETPSASPGASRRASPNAESTPTLAPDSSTATQNGYGNDGHHNGHNGSNTEYRPSLQSELMGALGSNDNGMQYNSQMFGGSNVTFYPGPYHPDYLSQMYPIPSDTLPYSPDDSSDDSGSGSESRSIKRRRLSNSSTSEPPSSAVSYGSYSDSFSSSSSASQQSVDFPFTPYTSFSNMLRGSGNTPWHPPMLPPDSSPHFIHPPMLPPSEDSPMYFHPQGMQNDDTDALFAAYLHPPMVPQDDSPPMSSLQLHPPMMPNEWKAPGQTDMYDNNAMVTF